MLLLERLGRGLVTYFRPRRGAASFGGFPLLKPAVISQLEGGGELEGPSPLASAAGTGPQGLWTEEPHGVAPQQNVQDHCLCYYPWQVPCLDPKDTGVKKADNCSLMKSCGLYGPEVLTPCRLDVHYSSEEAAWVQSRPSRD
ncbi:hypothetical protein E5288_WYG014540 [Bos mutus]|uniref:Uncharacterized protein n=1 Tax=Bos mutus TaxID=72004 RepID=A0A6B0R3H7_9CETA|nr:hypothetical protein [Bos mutus]